MAFDPLTLLSILMTLGSVSASIFMINQRRLLPLTTLRKGGRNLTYVGMLIATTKEKKQGGLALGFLSSLILR